MLSSSIPNDVIDQLTLSLLHNSGVATLSLPDHLTQIHQQAFQVATRALDVSSSYVKANSNSNGDNNSNGNPAPCPIILPNSNSATVTGYHSAGGDNALSRYNLHRQGFVFSNGESFPFIHNYEHEHENGLNGNVDNNVNVNVNVDNNDLEESFQPCMDQMFDSICNVIASSVLKGIARHLEIDEEWFHDQYGPMDRSSQWHLKRYVLPNSNGNGDGNDHDENKHKNNDTGASWASSLEDQEVEWLPVHTDPSLISIIIHDAPGTNDNAMGLEYQVTQPQSQSNKNEKKERVWKEVGAHGHAVATILCGSLMSYITGGLFQSAKHRVMYRPLPPTSTATATANGSVSGDIRYRQAATLFLRPRGDSILTAPPSDVFLDRVVKIRRNCKFQDWLDRVSKNYQSGGPAAGNNANGKKSKQNGIKTKKTIANKTITNTNTTTNTEPVRNGDPMLWADEYTELSLHGCMGGELNGKEKYLGGELCTLNNHIYTIPGFARRILDMDVTVDPPKLELIGPDLPGEYKWLRGIPIGDYIYGIPCHSESILKINAVTKEVTLIQWDESLPGACPHNQTWKYHGASVSDYDGCIYCIPQAAERVLKIDPRTDEMTFIGPAFPGVNKWYGGLLLRDGGIYGICQNARGILRIDPKTQECTVHGDFPEGHYKWHGAVKHTDGNLYCTPAHADQVLKIEPGIVPKLTLLGEKIRTGEHRSDNKYKFLGGAVGGDCVYFFPSDADYVCEVNTITGQVREVGPNLRDHERMRNNKWQNGFTAVDGTIYGIPLKGETVLRIRPADKAGDEPDIATIGGPYLGLNKWEGGVSAANGDMYCMPLNHKYSLRIRPLSKENEEEKDVHYTHGNATLRSSGHTLRHSKGRTRGKDLGPKTGGNSLPDVIRPKHIIAYDISSYDLRNEVLRMLNELDPETIGTFKREGGEPSRLENLVVPKDSLLPKKRAKDKNGNGEIAQISLSDHVLHDVQFHQVFDAFVCEVILPEFKERLLVCGAIPKDKAVKFYYQRPPTLRIQPGPSTRAVTAHSDATYGHQDGELNFWMPLTDLTMTKTDLFCESSPGKEDYEPLGAQLGEAVAFHGSSCKHFAPPNGSNYTRVSLDFRVGVEPFFDPEWKMFGTKSDHTRKQVVL